MTESDGTEQIRLSEAPRFNLRRALVFGVIALLLIGVLALFILEAPEEETVEYRFAYNPYPIVPWGDVKDIDGNLALEAGKVPGHTYLWSFNDSTPQLLTSANPLYYWNHLGEFNVTLTVTNATGGQVQETGGLMTCLGRF